jgi:hypothetical protein
LAVVILALLVQTIGEVPTEQIVRRQTENLIRQIGLVGLNTSLDTFKKALTDNYNNTTVSHQKTGNI